MRLYAPVSPCLVAAAALLTAPASPATALAPPGPLPAPAATALAPPGPLPAPAAMALAPPGLLPAPAAPFPAPAAMALAQPAPFPASPATALAPAAPLPTCTASEDHTFPLTTRLHGGPGGYEAGGGPGTWYLDLTNTTDRTCAGLHPVIVLTDERHAPEPAPEPDRFRLEFYDGDRPHPVRLEPAGAGELTGVLAAEGAGFTVAAGRTLTVKLRLTVAPDAGPGPITAHAAVVQHGDGDGHGHGDRLGRSNAYRFRITSGTTNPAPTPSPTPSPPARLPFADELAGTGLGRTAVALVIATLLAAAGTLTVRLSRRRR